MVVMYPSAIGHKVQVQWAEVMIAEQEMKCLSFYNSKLLMTIRMDETCNDRILLYTVQIRVS